MTQDPFKLAQMIRAYERDLRTKQSGGNEMYGYSDEYAGVACDLRRILEQCGYTVKRVRDEL